MSQDRNASVSITRIPIADQRNVPHWVAMTASVVRVIRHGETGQVGRRAEARRGRGLGVAEDFGLVGGRLLFREANQEPGLAGFRGSRSCARGCP